MRYVLARLEDFERENTYRIFVTKSLQLIPQNKFITKDFTEFFKPQKIETRNGDEIALDIINRAGLNFGD